MKMFYTQNELSKLTDSEILGLTSFEGGGETYFYSELKKLQKEEDGSFSFSFSDNSVIYTKNIDVYNRVKLGKARYDMLMKSMESKKEQDEREELFLERATEMITKMVEQTGSGIKRIENEAKSFRTNAEKHLKVTEEKWNNQLDSLKEFDIKAYNIKMEKVDKIIEAFDKLLEE
jgi:hypothetical protein